MPEATKQDPLIYSPVFIVGTVLSTCRSSHLGEAQAYMMHMQVYSVIHQSNGGKFKATVYIHSDLKVLPLQYKIFRMANILYQLVCYKVIE